MAINALQVAWMSRLADKKIIREGGSILEFGPQDLLCAPAVVEQYGLRHRDADTVREVIEEAYEDGKPKPVLPSAFYSLFGTDRNHYRSLDLIDTRSDWIIDCNEPFTLPERFDVVTNFGTAEHVFNIAALFKSVHDVLKPGGVALHILPAFGDINHGFYNIHPTTYLDLSAANNYTIADLCYVDRWDIRNRTFEEDVTANFDFDSLPIQMEHLRDRFLLQRKVVDLYVANYGDPKTVQYGPQFPGYLYDYCLVALRKNDDRTFRYPVQGYYGGGVSPVSDPAPAIIREVARKIRPLRSPLAIAKAFVRRLVVPLVPLVIRRPLIRSALKAVLRDLVFNVTGKDLGLSLTEKWVSCIFKRQHYPPPPLDRLTMERMMTIVESRMERLYYNSELSVSISDINSNFISNAKKLLTDDAEFVSFVADRYDQRSDETQTRKKTIDDIRDLVLRR